MPEEFVFFEVQGLLVDAWLERQDQQMTGRGLPQFQTKYPNMLGFFQTICRAVESPVSGCVVPEWRSPWRLRSRAAVMVVCNGQEGVHGSR